MDRRNILGAMLASVISWLLSKVGHVRGSVFDTTSMRNTVWRTKQPNEPKKLPNRVIYCDLLEIINKNYFHDGFQTITKIDGKDLLREVTIRLEMSVDRSTKCTVVNSVGDGPHNRAVEVVTIYPKRLRLDCGNLTIRQEQIGCDSFYPADIKIGGIDCYAKTLAVSFTEGEIVVCTIEHAVQPVKRSRTVEVLPTESWEVKPIILDHPTQQ